MSRVAILAPLRHRAFRLLFAGQVISDLGDWLDMLALITLIAYRWELGPGALAALSVVMALPFAVVGPVAGVWVDRWPRRSVMITSDLARAALVLGLFWAPDLLTVLMLVGAREVVSTFFSPARQAAIASTVPDEDLLAANSLSRLSWQASKVLGPALGGVLVAAAGPRAAFVADALTFLASAAFLSRLPPLAPVSPPGEVREHGFWADLRAGLGYVLRRRTLAIAVGSMALAMFIVSTFDSLGALALKALGVGESLLGLAVGSIGLGTAVGAVAIGQWGKRFNPFAIMGFGQVGSGIAVALVGAAVMLGVDGAAVGWIPVWLLVGLTGAAMFVPYRYVLQRETPPALMGRVSATADGLQTAFLLAGPPLGAIMASHLGLGLVFAAAGAALSLLGVGVLLIRPEVREVAGPGGGGANNRGVGLVEPR